MPLFRRTPTVKPSEVADLRHELAELRSLLTEATEAKTSLEQRLADLEAARHDETKTEHGQPLAAVPPARPNPPPPPPSTSLEEVKSIADRAAEAVGNLQSQVAQLAERLAATDRSPGELTAAMEARITQLGNELTCQIDELAGELEELRQRSAATVAVGDPAVIDELRAGQVRLANEQARYEIAFRQDLAQLADQLLRRVS